jgi:hypothetical protein
VSVNCYISWLVCVAILSPYVIPCIFKTCFPLLFTFFAIKSSENWPKGRKGRRGKYVKRGAHTFILGFQQEYSIKIPFGLVARLHGSHLGGSGSISGMGT